MRRSDWTLLVLAAADGDSLTPVQLQKCLFLLGENVDVGTEYYAFAPYHYGPFDSAVYHDAETMAREGLVSITRGRVREFSATPAGVAQCRSLGADAGTREYVRQLVHWARSLSFQEIVRAVYDRYPSMRENSIFRG